MKPFALCFAALLLAALSLSGLLPLAAGAQGASRVDTRVGPADSKGLGPTPGMVTMLAFTSEISPAARMMAPAVDATRKEFEGKASVIVIDVDKHPDALAIYGVRAVPSQIFFDSSGREASRHDGFMRQADMRIRLFLLGAR